MPTETQGLIRCSIHGIPDCSPMLNGCTLVNRAHQAAEGEEFCQPQEPVGALAVVQDVRGRRWFRWSCYMHTHAPWALLGATNADTEDTWRWADLPPVVVVAEGLPIWDKERSI